MDCGPFLVASPGGRRTIKAHLAVRHGHPKMIELLVAKGAKLDATESMGRTPADLLQRSADLMMTPWPPSPYRGPGPGIPVVVVHRDPARAAEVTETLRKLGAVIPSTRGATFNNRSLPPGFPGQPGFPVPAPPAFRQRPSASRRLSMQ
ncbi:MAG: hypothetical protein ABMA26_25795, partial [Limisphaerales bacterium]